MVVFFCKVEFDVYETVICLPEQVVAIKQLNHDGLQGYQEFIVEVLMLSLLHHCNLVTLIGYCTDGDQRLLVYEYMSMGSLENHLFGKCPSFFTLCFRRTKRHQARFISVLFLSPRN